MVAPEVGKDKVLVIDDDRGPRESLRILLKNDYTVLCADGVDAGMRLLKEEAPAAIVMDIRMPGKSGIEGLGEIRALDPDVAVIMLTGHGSLETAQEAIRLGADDYLRKPFDTGEMLSLVQHHVQQTHTARRRAQAESELEDLNRRMHGQLSAMNRMASLGLASSELVHDLRNPISVVQGYVELLSLELGERTGAGAALSPEIAGHLQKMQRNLRRCAELIEMWQSLGRSHEGRVGTVSLRQTIRELLQATRRLHPSVDLRFLGEEDPEPLAVAGDALQLSRALQNIIANAAQAVPRENGCVLVQCQEEDGQVTIDVQDNGCGIDAEHIQRVFEPFYTNRKDRKGTGLGLFISATVIKDHGGKIDIYSRVGEGTTVRIQLPKQYAAEISHAAEH